MKCLFKFAYIFACVLCLAVYAAPYEKEKDQGQLSSAGMLNFQRVLKTEFLFCWADDTASSKKLNSLLL